MDRAHRIGQRRAVAVYRLICRETLEEQIMGLQVRTLQTGGHLCEGLELDGSRSCLEGCSNSLTRSHPDLAPIIPARHLRFAGAKADSPPAPHDPCCYCRPATCARVFS